MKVLVIHNLRSGLRNGAVYDFVRSYAAEGDSVTIRTLGANTPLAELMSDAAEHDFVIASGGDGTVASVAYELRNTGIPLLPFPAGTANLLALNLFEPNESHALCKVVDEAKTLDFDMGEIEDANGKKLGFSVMAGCGYDELIMRNATGHKHLLGDMAYFEAAVANPTPQVSDFTITIDGETIQESGIGVVLANFSKMQFDLMVSDENLPRDGYLDVVVLKTENAVQLLPTVMAKVFDHTGALAKKVGGLQIYRGKEIQIDADPAMLVEYDGEPSEVSTPITARCLPRATRFIVTEECYKHFNPEA
jgi:diacylglycerol kinase family enzyme